MTHMTSLHRRGFLGLAGAGAAGVAFLPLLRRVAAQTAAEPRARRLLVINLSGGVRSSAAFLASSATRYNPYGLIEGTGTPFALGRLLDDTPPGRPPLGDEAYLLEGEWGGARLPRLREVANQFAVVGTWSEARGDHLIARIEEPTGSSSGGDPGLLTRIAAALTERSGDLDVPAFHLAPEALFGAGRGPLGRHAPVALAGWYSLPSAGSADPYAVERTGHRWLADPAMGERFDRPRVDGRAGWGRLVADTHAVHRRAARQVGGRLGQADMQVGDAGDARGAALGQVMLDGGAVPLTNGMLFDLCTRALGPLPETGGETTESPTFSSALDAALAVRLLQLGSPAVALEIGDFDTHAAERDEGPPLYSFIGRLWASLAWLLARVADPGGGSLLDHTLVLTMSDFGRDPAGPTGWNDGEGSDHGADPGCFYLAHAVMGAGVVGGRLIAGVSTDDYDARREPLRIAPPRLLATAMAALELDPADEQFGFPAAGGPIEELWAP